VKTLFLRAFNSAVAWSFLGTFLRLGASVLVLPLILKKLPPEHLGLWYVFGTIGSLAALLDLGFEPTITRMVSYVWGGASRLTAFGLHEPDAGAAARGPNHPLLHDLLATLRAYYRWVGLGVLLLLTFGGGAWIWIKTEDLPAATSLRGAWLLYAFGACLNFVSGRWPALLIGLGAIRQSQQISIVSLLVYYVAAVLGLLLGAGLWSMVIGLLLMGWLARFLGRIGFCSHSGIPEPLPTPSFHREVFAAIWPHAWRMGLVSFGAFLIVQANTLICSAFLGLATTASYGISFQLLAMLVGISSVWVQVKMPLINQLRVSGDHPAIARIFAARVRLVLLTYALGALCIIFIAPIALNRIGSRTELLPFWPLTVFCLIQFLEMHHSLYATLVLSENLNPFLKPALLSGVAIVILSSLLAPRMGIWGLLISAGVVQACYNNWWPVVRALSGLNVSTRRYWAYFFWLRSL
jgi:O-antigen/teichoic acid export membrane protein